MKLNNKLFLLTATLGIMAAASTTAFASHRNYVYITNQTNSQINVTETWQSGGQHQHFYLSENCHHSQSPLFITIPNHTTKTIYEDENSGWTTGTDQNSESYSGIAQLNFYMGSGAIQDADPENVDIRYHVFYTVHDNWMGSDGYYCHWNHTLSAQLTGQKLNSQPVIYIENSQQSQVCQLNTPLTCPNYTKMSIIVGAYATPSPNASSTSSPMGKFSNMLHSIKF